MYLLHMKENEEAVNKLVWFLIGAGVVIVIADLLSRGII